MDPLFLVSWAVGAAATLIVPITAALYCAVRRKRVRAVVFGVLCFVLSQICIRMPLLQYVLPRSAGYLLFTYTHPVLYLAMLGTSAGVAEEVGRYLFLRAGNMSECADGVAFGIGHGGVEAVLFSGIPIVMMLADPFPAATAEPSEILCASLERLSAMGIHVALSLLVLQSVQRRKLRLLLLAVLIHGLFDFAMVFLAQRGVNPWLVEAAAWIVAAVMLAVAWAFRRKQGRSYQCEERSDG